MKRYKTVLSSNLSSSQITDVDAEIEAMEKEEKKNDKNTLTRKYELIQKELELEKQSKKILEKELAAYRKVVLKNGDISELLEMQQEKIFELTTNMEILQNKYEKILNSNGSSSQTEYAVKCKELEKIIRNKEFEHQQEMSTLKNKMMKMSANEIVERGRETDGPMIRTNSSLGPNIITPLKNSRKLV